MDNADNSLRLLMANRFGAKPEDVAYLLEELSIHQAELVAQNQQLRSTQDELNAACRRLEHLYEFAPVGYLSLTLAGEILEINGFGARLLATEPSRIQGLSILQIVEPDYVRNFKEHLELVAQKGVRQRVRVSLVRADGNSLTLQFESLVVMAVDSSHLEIRSAFIDMSDTVAQEREIQRLSSAINQSRAFLALIGADGQLRFASQALLDFMGRNPLKGATSIAELCREFMVHPEQIETIYKDFRERDAQGLIWEGEVLLTNEARERRWIGCSIQRVHAKDARDYLFCAHDVTPLKTQTSLEQSRRHHAEAASRAKTTFLAKMSHDLRTPLTTILGYAELVYREITEPRTRRFMALIAESGKHLQSLLNDMLDLSKIDSGRLDLVHECFPMTPLLERLREEISTLLDKKDVRFDLCSDIRDELLVEGDSVRITQICRNLLNNAVKATESGLVRLDVTHAASWLRFRISDTGCGISEEHLSEIFAPFVQGGRRVGYDQRGSGLGLAIVRQLVDLMEGHIHVQSTVAKGTSFEVVLPVVCRETEKELPEIVPMQEISEESKLAVRLIVADDHKANAELVMEMVIPFVDEVEMCFDGTEVVHKLNMGQKYELAFLDIEMPGLDGVSTLQFIRDSVEHRNMTVVALTAHALVGDRERFLAAGFNDVVTKPVEMQNLADVLSRFRAGFYNHHAQHAMS